jgi:hypothetical protein
MKQKRKKILDTSRMGRYERTDEWKKRNGDLHSKLIGELGTNYQGKNVEYQNWGEALKRKARTRDNYTCQLCGARQYEFSRALDVHHKNGIKTDGNLDNLLTVCSKCHKTLHPRGKGKN